MFGAREEGSMREPIDRDLIRVEGLEVRAEIGVYSHERGVLQPLVIDLALETDIALAAESDAISNAVDYTAAAEIARDVVREAHHGLIETVAERIAERLLAQLGARVPRVFVRVAKPGAVPDARTVSVEIWRSWKR
jgi:7,8-dihydroneopterin aldolase/epimerase/oxygenase